MSFQEYLRSIGFVPFSYEIVKGNIIEVPCKNENFFSTMSPLYVIYKKDNIKILYGLNEHNFPPTICSPRPNVCDEQTGRNFIHIGNGLVSSCVLYDRALTKYGNEKVYDSMINGTLLLV